MQQRKEITIKSSDIEIGQKSHNEQFNSKDNKHFEIAENQQVQQAQINIIPVLAFKNISQVSVNKGDGGYGASKKSKVKNINFWVQKNRQQILSKQFPVAKQGNQNQQKSLFQQEIQIEDQENQLRPNMRKESNGLAGITIDFKRDPSHKSVDQSPIMGPIKQNSKNEQIIQEKGFDFIDEEQSKKMKNSDIKKGGAAKGNKSQQKKEDSQKQRKYMIAEKGYEWDVVIENDFQLINKILDESQYRPSKEWKEQFEKDISEILLGSEVQDKRAVGSLLGITVFGIVGFVASGLNPIGLVAGAVAGGVIGQYAGRKIKKKLLRTKKLLQFDLFTLKLNCYIKFGLELMKPFKFDINTYRFYLEKVIEEMKVAIQYRRFRQKFHKDIKKILEKFLRLMKKDLCYKAIFLSYKLTKEIIKRKKFQENNMPEFTAEEEEQIIDTVLNVLTPTLNILRDSPELTPVLKSFQFKLEKLLKDYVILSLIEKGNQVSSNKNKTIKQIEELDQQLDQEINIEAFERIFNPEHIKQFINKEDNMTLSAQAQGGMNDHLNTPKIGESGARKNLASSQQRKSHQIKLGQDGEQVQELQSFSSNNQNNNESNKYGDDELRQSGTGQKEQRQQRIIDLYLEAMEMRNKVLSSQKKEEENDIGEDENGDKQDEIIIDDPSAKKKGSQNYPNQYPTFSKQHLSKIAQKEYINQSPANPYKDNQDELQEMDRINQKQTSFQIDANLIDQTSNTTTNNQEYQRRKVSNIQIKFDQLPKKQLDVDQESIKSSTPAQSKVKITQQELKSPIEIISNKQPSINLISRNEQGSTLSQMPPSSQISQPQITQNNLHNIPHDPQQPFIMKEAGRSFARNDNRTFLKMNSDESLFSKKDQSPTNQQQTQLVGDIDQPMRDSIMHSQVVDQEHLRIQVDTPKRKSNFNTIDSQKRGSILGKQINMQGSQVLGQKPNSQFRQSIVVSKDDNDKEEIVVVNIPEIPKDDKMTQSVHKEDDGSFDPQTQEKFDRLISLVKEDPEKTWECVIKKDDSMFIYKKMIPGNPCVLVRAESVIKDCNADEVFVQIYNAEIRSQWDKVTQGFTVIEKISEIVDVIYFFVDPGLGVTKRDFCQTRVLKKDYPVKGQTTIVFFSITHPSCPERKGFIRAFSHIAGYVIRPQGKDTSLTIMTQSDVKGIVPKYVVNFMAARAPPKWIESMRKGCIDFRTGKSGTQKKKK